MTDYRGLVAALRCDGAYRYDGCKGCLYERRCLVATMMQDAAQAIEELMAEIEHIRPLSVSHEAYQMACRERDAAVEDLKLALIDEALDPCHCCEYGCTDHCTHPGGPTCGETGGKNWKWRGPQNEKGE